MKLHQLKVEYDAEQDRLIMLVATSEAVELRLALTRRFVKLLLGNQVILEHLLCARVFAIRIEKVCCRSLHRRDLLWIRRWQIAVSNP